jgi:raffinose/stachyose/melibiose transport system permease protein
MANQPAGGPTAGPPLVAEPRLGGVRIRRDAHPARRARDVPLPGEPRRVAYAFLAPAFVVYALFALLPFVHSVYLSFFSWDGIGPRHWVGLNNYKAIFDHGELRTAFIHSFILIFFYSVLPTLIALLLVAIISRSRVRGLTGFRIALFLPYVLAPTAVAVIWRWVLAPTGPVNAFLSDIGLGSLTRVWLGNFTFALPSVGLVGTWVMLGLALVLLLAGAQKIPTELYESARIDGAGGWWEFRVVTLPGLKYEIAVVLVLTVTAALRNFDLIYVMTGGGPGTSTTVPSWLVYNQAFVVGAVGAAAALGVTLAVLVSVVNIIIARIGRAAT